MRTATKALSCAANADSPASLVQTCATDFLDGRSHQIAACTLEAGEKNWATAAQSCAEAVGAPAEATRVVHILQCAQNKAGDPKASVLCLASGNGDQTKAVETAACAANAKDTTELATCAVPHLGGTGGKVAACLAAQKEGERDPLKCATAADPQLAAAQRAYECAKQAGDPAAMIDACGQGVIDPRTRQMTSCLVRAGGDRDKIAACAAQGLLPGEAGRLAGCAASSQGAASFAICAAAPSVNEERRIAAECAVSSGGEPISFASCTGGRLTVRELGKCLKGEIGKEGGCFGPNNTIVVFHRNAINDLTKGPGKNNEGVKIVSGVWETTKDALDKPVKDIGNFIEGLGKGIDRTVQDTGKKVKEFAKWAGSRLGIKRIKL